jgi:hypothetical protein
MGRLADRLRLPRATRFLQRGGRVWNPRAFTAPFGGWVVPGITTYTQLAGIALLVVAAAGLALFGWEDAAIYYHAGVGLLFLFVGYARLETTIVRQMVRGLGVLLVAVKGVTILVSWLLPTPYFLHGPVKITCLVLGIASILAARYLPDQRSRRDGRGVS